MLHHDVLSICIDRRRAVSDERSDSAVAIGAHDRNA